MGALSSKPNPYFDITNHEKFTGKDSEWSGTHKPGMMERFVKKYGYRAVYKYELWSAGRRYPDGLPPTSPTQPSMECYALNRIFRYGVGRMDSKLKNIRQPGIALIGRPVNHLPTVKILNLGGRGFDCWHIKAVEGLDRPRKMIFYVHGGGFVGGDWAGFNGYCEALHTRFGGVPLFFPNYRMAPEVSIPDQVDDCIAAYEFATKGDTAIVGAETEVIVMGDSCGGAVGLLMLQKLADLIRQGSDLQMPSAAVFYSPVTDLSCSGESHQSMATGYFENSRVDGETIGEVTFDPKVIKECFAYAAAESGNASYKVTDPRISPLFGNFEGLPPLYLMASASEVFADDARRAAARAREVNIPVLEDIWESIPGAVMHSWPVFDFPEAEIAFARVESWLNTLPKQKKQSTPKHGIVSEC